MATRTQKLSTSGVFKTFICAAKATSAPPLGPKLSEVLFEKLYFFDPWAGNANIYIYFNLLLIRFLF